MKTVKANKAKAKGSRAERQWRDELKRIYDTSAEREKIKRVPMSGASWMKGDVVDLNDYDTLYEVKNCEKLEIPSWWRQAVREAGSSRTPVLAITQNNRPFFVFMEPEDFKSLMELCGFQDAIRKTLWKQQRGLLDAIDKCELYDVVEVLVGQKEPITLIGIKGDHYIRYKLTAKDVVL